MAVCGFVLPRGKLCDTHRLPIKSFPVHSSASCTCVPKLEITPTQAFFLSFSNCSLHLSHRPDPCTSPCLPNSNTSKHIKQLTHLRFVLSPCVFLLLECCIDVVQRKIAVTIQKKANTGIQHEVHARVDS